MLGKTWRARWCLKVYSGLGGARSGYEGLKGARRSVKFTVLAKNLSVFAENVIKK
jgi:hypothetical protein